MVWLSWREGERSTALPHMKLVQCLWWLQGKENLINYNLKRESKTKITTKISISICRAGPKADTGAGVGRRASLVDVRLVGWDGCVSEHHIVNCSGGFLLRLWGSEGPFEWVCWGLNSKVLRTTVWPYTTAKPRFCVSGMLLEKGWLIAKKTHAGACIK
jgi:hypothetical protein